MLLLQLQHDYTGLNYDFFMDLSGVFNGLLSGMLMSTMDASPHHCRGTKSRAEHAKETLSIHGTFYDVA